MIFARYLTPGQEHRRLGLVCLGVGWQQVHAMQFQGRVLGCYQLTLITAGTGWFRSGSAQAPRIPVQAPAAFLLFPGLYHAYSPDPTGWREHWVLFEGPTAAAYEELGFLDRNDPITSLSAVKPLRAGFDRLLTAVEPGAPNREVVTSAVVHQLITDLKAVRVHEDGSRVVRYFDEHATEPLTVGEHARRLGLDEASLRGEMQRATGTTPKEYIVRTRLSRAKRLLLATDQPVREVARNVGYDDAAYFTRLFTRRVNQSPTEFRKSGQA
ncbi:AraC family transcriptional regulator [Yinghuangia seranimata]|uniref:AraC family transcriptional regulator n=1 Tax=Yinghuangia seranimata TaxID=408067 RepID=UPI00248ABB54|nr:AraC family transcriptional regulator [Yinghuangia seranimata]MDI2125501.1 AraC family transcriptional regulator [Yinghuangia seranimata]